MLSKWPFSCRISEIYGKNVLAEREMLEANKGINGIKKIQTFLEPIKHLFTEKQEIKLYNKTFKSLI